MPTTSSIAGGTQTASEVKSEKNAPTPTRPGSEDLDFARMLAATVRSQAEDSLASIAAPANSSGWSGSDSRFAQLGFLNQPASMPLPSFMASRWQQPTGAQPLAGAQQPVGGQPNAGPAPSTSATGQGVSGLGGTNPFSPLVASQGAAGSNGVSPLAASGKVSATAGVSPNLPAWGKKTDFSAFPRPAGDNGRGIHWIPTPRQSPDVIDKYVGEAQSMGIKWVTLLNDGVNRGDNDYLVDKLNDAGIEPVMRLYTDGGAALEGDVQALVRHYGQKGVNYFQLYNEPNLRIENQGKAPDPKGFAAKWLADARKVVAAGGLPGFGSLSPTPGLAPGAAPGDMDDLRFLRESLQEVVRLGGQDVLEKTWLSVHNYGYAHLRVRDYDKVVNEVLGRSLPQVGTEAGIYPGDTLSQSQATEIVADAYRYLPGREDYYFAYTYWIIANDPGQGYADAAWNHQALFRPDGHSPIVDVLRQEV